MNIATPPILGSAFYRFAAACLENPSGRDYFNYAEPQFEQLLNQVAFELPAYERAAAGWDVQSKKHIKRVRAGNDLREFFKRTDAFTRIHSGRFDAICTATAFEEEVAREFCEMTQCFVLDGLELPLPEVLFRRGRFIKLTEPSLSEIAGPALELHNCNELYVLELKWRSSNPPWGSGVPENFEDPQSRLQQLAHPWIAFINLWAHGKVRVVGAFERTDSGLCSSHRYIEIAEPVWEDRYGHNDERDVDEWISESPRRTLTIPNEKQFVAFLERLDEGLQRSGLEANRADIAMRYFRRVSENFWTYHIGNDGTSQDSNEDIIVDAMTTLETLLLANEGRGKSDLLAKRAAAILEDSDDKRRSARKRIEGLYKLRSAILHGDQRPSTIELTQAAVDAEAFSRRCLAAFLLSDGDRQSFLQASTDAAIAERLRARIKL